MCAGLSLRPIGWSVCDTLQFAVYGAVYVMGLYVYYYLYPADIGHMLAQLGLILAGSTVLKRGMSSLATDVSLREIFFWFF